jgi:hypothetical protein
MRKALVVGINDYKGSLKLTGSVNDAAEVSKLLKHNGDGSTNFEMEPADNISEKTDLIARIIELFRPPSEVALFYFSGHGCNDFFDYHIVTPDERLHDPGISMLQLLDIANKSPATNKIIILDCCHAAGMGVTKPTSGMIVSLNDGITIMASSRANEEAWESGGHGVFTNLFIEALKDGAADLNGNISPGGIYAYIDKAMGQGRQRPVFKTNISEFVSLRKVVPQVPDETMRNLSVFFPQADYHFPLDPSHEDTNDPSVVHEYIVPYAQDENVKIFKQLQNA